MAVFIYPEGEENQTLNGQCVADEHIRRIDNTRGKLLQSAGTFKQRLEIREMQFLRDSLTARFEQQHNLCKVIALSHHCLSSLHTHLSGSIQPPRSHGTTCI